MDYVYKNSQLVALALQKARLDKFTDGELFKSTLLIPSENYCVKYRDCLSSKLNFDNARQLMLANIVSFELDDKTLQRDDYIPKLDGGFINFNTVKVNCRIPCTNGVIIVLDGFLEP